MVRKRKVTLWTPGIKSLLWNLELKWLVQRPGMQRLWTLSLRLREASAEDLSLKHWSGVSQKLTWALAGIPKNRLDAPTSSLSLQQQCGGYQKAQQEGTIYLIFGQASAAAVFEKWWSFLSFLPDFMNVLLIVRLLSGIHSGKGNLGNVDPSFLL